jgi:hypothetical protein
VKVCGCAVSVLALFITACVPVNARQGMRTKAPSYTRFWNFSVGSGAAYAVVTADAGRKTLLEIAVLGEQPVKGKIAYWVEISSQAEGRNRWLVGKALLYLDSRRKQVVVTRLFMQWPGFAPMDISGHMAGLGTFAEGFVGVLSGYRDVHLSPATEDMADSHIPDLTIDTNARLHAQVPEAKDLGQESVGTQAGTFSCEHFKFAGKAGEVWVSKQAAPFGLVKVYTNGATMLLTRLLTGVEKDRIEMVPRPYDVDTLLKVPTRFGGTFWDWVLIPRR